MYYAELMKKKLDVDDKRLFNLSWIVFLARIVKYSWKKK